LESILALGDPINYAYMYGKAKGLGMEAWAIINLMNQGQFTIRDECQGTTLAENR